ncbi:MAG: phasin family protein [Sphingomonadaceae bacterium]|nr:phasin family protein [Sphingomonadaceae bacterium]
MATRVEDNAERAYAAAAAELPAKAPKAAKPVAAKPVKTAKPVADAPVKVAAEVAPKAVAVEAAPKAAPKAALAKKPAKKVAKKIAVKKATPKKAAAPKTTIRAAKAASTTFTKGKSMLNEATAQMTEQATKLVGEARTRTEAFVADMQVRAKEAGEKGQAFAKEAVEFSKGNVEAFVESAKIVAKGAEVIGQEIVAFAKASVEDTTNAAQRYAAVKTPAEFFALQNELSRTALDNVVKHGSKTTELSVKLANDAFQPISNRIALAVSKLKSAA